MKSLKGEEANTEVRRTNRNSFTVTCCPRLKVPRIDFIYGAADWMDRGAADALREPCARAGIQTSVQVVHGAGHQLCIEHPDNTAEALLQALA